MKWYSQALLFNVSSGGRHSSPTACEVRRHPPDTPARSFLCLPALAIARRRYLHRLLLLSLLTSFSPMATAEKGFHDDEFLLDSSDVPVVLSASRLLQPISESPASITVIDQEMINASGARTIHDLLRMVPGVQVGEIHGGVSVVTYHGFAARYNPHLQLLVDGRPTYVPLYGGVPWSQIPVTLEEIERIEVIRAPNAATFGPNSFNVVVSITTRSPASSKGWFVNSHFGGNQFSRNSLSWYGGFDQTDYRAIISHEQTKGFADVNDSASATTLTYRSGTQLNRSDRLLVGIGLLNAVYTEPLTAFEPGDLDQEARTRNGYFQLGWERTNDADDSTHLRYYFNYFDIHDHEWYELDLERFSGDPAHAGLPLWIDLNRSSNSQRHELEYQRTLRLNERHRLAYGGAIRRDTVQSRYVLADDEPDNINTQRLFVLSEFRLSDKYSLNSGLLVENNSLADLTASPRLSLIYRYNNRKQLRLSYARGVRTPLSLEKTGTVAFDYHLPTGDIYQNIIVRSNPDTEPEYTDVVDIGFFHVDPLEGLTLDFKLSHERARKLVHLSKIDDPADPVDGSSRIYDNHDWYRLTSAEIDANYQPTNNFRLRFAYSHILYVDHPSIQILVPPDTLSVLGIWKLPARMSFSAEYYNTSSWHWDDTWEKSRLNRMDLRLARDFRLGRLSVNAFVQTEMAIGNNIEYFPRNNVQNEIYAGIKIKFQ